MDRDRKIRLPLLEIPGIRIFRSQKIDLPETSIKQLDPNFLGFKITYERFTDISHIPG